MNWNYSDDIHSVIDNETYDKGVTTMMIVAMEVTRTGAPSTAHLPRFYLCLIWNKLASVESSFFCLNRFNSSSIFPSLFSSCATTVAASTGITSATTTTTAATAATRKTVMAAAGSKMTQMTLETVPVAATVLPVMGKTRNSADVLISSDAPVDHVSGCVHSQGLACIQIHIRKAEFKNLSFSKVCFFYGNFLLETPRIYDFHSTVSAS